MDLNTMTGPGEELLWHEEPEDDTDYREYHSDDDRFYDPDEEEIDYEDY